MKELSIEQKAKAYDEAIEELRGLLEGIHEEKCDIMEEDIIKIFPELKESIDERIKKVIKQVLSESTTEKDECYLDNGVTQQEVFAWLEKQGKNNMCISEATKRKLEDNLNKALEKETAESWNEFLEKQGEQKPVIPKFRVGDIIRWKKADSVEYTIKEINDKGYINTAGGIMDILQTDIDFELVEQKPAWSEDDNKKIDNLISQLGNLFARKLIKEETKDKYVNWLKSIKDRAQPQPKQEWSEDDERYLNNTISYLKDATEFKETAKLCIDWLKSLRPQSHWKPSEGQILAINTAINVLGKGTLNGKQLIELQEQLKKLKEE